MKPLSGTFLLCLDPAVKCAGWALFRVDEEQGVGELVDYGTWRALRECSADAEWVERMDALVRFLQAKIEESRGEGGIEYFVTEVPEVYPSGKGEAANNSGSVMKLAACAWSARQMARDNGCEVWTYRPRDWKGQCPKEITLKRMVKKWGISERTDNNAVDAIGIGTKWLSDLSNGSIK